MKYTNYKNLELMRLRRGFFLSFFLFPSLRGSQAVTRKGEDSYPRAVIVQGQRSKMILVERRQHGGVREACKSLKEARRQDPWPVDAIR